MSGLKAIVVGAAVIVGALVLLNGFGSSGSPAPAPDVQVAPSPSAPATRPPRSPKPVREKPTVADPSPTIEGIRLGVYNATSTAGLATKAADDLQAEGYTIKQLGNAVDTSKTSAVYYLKSQDSESAQTLADKTFKGLTAEELPADYTIKDENDAEGPPAKGVQVVVIVGEDYKAK